MRRVEIGADFLQLHNGIGNSLAVTASLHILEVNDGLAVEVDNPRLPLIRPRLDISRLPRSS